MPSASAVSSTESPPKNRSSATRLFRGSNDARAVSACVQIEKVHIRRRRLGATAASSVTRAHPPERLAILRRRAWSTRMRRIISDATAKKCAAILPVGVLLVDESKVRLVDERGRLQDVPVPLAPKPRRGAAAQLLMDDRHELVPRGEIAQAPRVEQSRHIPVGNRQCVLRVAIVPIALHQVKAP